MFDPDTLKKLCTSLNHRPADVDTRIGGKKTTTSSKAQEHPRLLQLPLATTDHSNLKVDLATFMALIVQTSHCCDVMRSVGFDIFHVRLEVNDRKSHFMGPL